MKIYVREAHADDAETLARLVTQLGYPSQPAEMAQRLAALPPGPHLILVAMAGKEIVGLIQVSRWPTLLLGNGAEIVALVVDERHRSQGIGQALVKAAEAWALENGCSTIYVRANVIRERAHAFYRRLGYDQVKTSFTFAKPLSAACSPFPAHGSSYV